MPNFDIIENVRNLSLIEKNRLKNAKLNDALGTVLNNERTDETSNNSLLLEKRNWTREIEQMKQTRKDVIELSSELKQAFDIIIQQQMFMESLDARDRRRKIIITGVSEVEDILGWDDHSKVRRILDEVGCDEASDFMNWEIKRLGQENDRRMRPILIVLNDKRQRNKILDKAKNLKGKHEPFSSIYVKKDTHPAIRKELGRLRKRERDEKYKPENEGVNIFYDKQRRVLLRDGLVIDRYAPSYF